MEVQTEIVIKPVEIVEIYKKTPIYKNGEAAERIELINFKYKDGSACGYDIISQKDLYEIGSKAVYIQPDYCLQDIPIFSSFVRPFDDPKKSKLGKNLRIKAVKFNFSRADSMDPIYSFGILMPENEVIENLNFSSESPQATYSDEELCEMLGITKYEEPEKGSSGSDSKEFPYFLYKTDEINYQNCTSSIKYAIENNEEFGTTIKRDGSSWTMYVRKNEAYEFYHGICSRKFEKILISSYIDLYVCDKVGEFHKYFNQETKILGWFNDNSKQFFTNEEIAIAGFKTVEKLIYDSWVDLAVNNGYVEKLTNYCKAYDVELAFRGELIGQGLKGSGNKYNPDSKNKQTIMLFGVDSLGTGKAVRTNLSDEHNLEKVAIEAELPFTEIKKITPTSLEELEEFCKNIFKEEEAAGRIIEGVVIRTTQNNKISCKYMNPKYDEKK